MVNIRSAMRLLGGVVLSAAVSLHHSPAHGQTAAGTGGSPPPNGSPAASSEAERSDAATIVVTGTRITSRGFTAPTPTTIVTAEDLSKTAQPNIFTSVTQLPSLQGSTGTNTGTFSTSSGQQGLSSFSLRGLGAIRTLTLLDGQRVVGANVTGVPDISQFPQLLIQRVDVVTGGASASYGSDAVGGVVNFVTDKRFEGVKGIVQGGITTYGDDGQFLVGAAAGHSLFDDRLHLEGSAEYDHENGVGPGGFGERLAGGRNWFRASTLLNTNIKDNGLPQYNYADHAQSTTYSKWGLITSGPFQYTAFDASGNHGPFQKGSPCYTGFCVGGDNSGAVGAGASLVSSVERLVGFGRIGFSLNDDNEIYATFNLASVKSRNQPNPGAFRSGLDISCANPYVPADIAATGCNGSTKTPPSFSYGLDNAFLPNPYVKPKREQQRYVLGAEGKVGVGSDWHYDAYYEHAMNTTDVHVFDIPLNPHYNQAINAATLNGQIVCASAVARAAGCVPINIFGGDIALTPEQLAYVDPSPGPFQHTHQTEDAASLAINGEPVSLWAGPLSVAFGAEWRREYYRVVGDPYGNGVTADSPNTEDYPADPVLVPGGANWYAGNYHNGSGQYHVTEAFLETNVPFIDSELLGKANLNLAGRWTDYSTSGTVYTWKIGGSWQTPYSPLRLRAVVSRDVRAPNLSELFAAPTTTTSPGITQPGVPGTITVLQNTIGNPNLKPEQAKNYELGLVLTNPSGLEGFSASVDYYNIKITDIISTLSAQQQVNFCKDVTLQLYCDTLNLAPTNGAQPFVNVQAFNLASVKTKGVDIEASYQMPLDRIHAPGKLTIRALATHVIDFTSYSGIKNVPNVELAGQNSGGSGSGSGTIGNTPHWKVYGSQSWDWDNLGVDLTERWFSAGVFGYQYVVCQSNCPVSTTNNPTINYNHMAGALYFDVGARYSITDGITAFVKVDNAFNKDPVPAPQTNTGLDVNPALYDTIGRVYRAGFRFNF
ncbi:MAG: TonB-dependent receptor plug domain-containing protein [Steroidobacteraceae bacterium]